MEPRTESVIQSVIRACKILERISKKENGITAKEISDSENLNLSTCYHILKSLQTEGYVEVDPYSRKYYLGYKISSLYNGMFKNQRLPAKVRPYLEMINNSVKETVYLAIYKNNETIIIDSIEGLHPLKASGFVLGVGYNNHAHARASGKLLLSYLSEDELEQHIRKNPLIKLTKNTISNKNELTIELKKCLELGYALDNEEFYEGICCVAAPILNNAGKAIAAIAISFPTIRKNNLDLFIKVLLEVTTEISQSVV